MYIRIAWYVSWNFRHNLHFRKYQIKSNKMIFKIKHKFELFWCIWVWVWWFQLPKKILHTWLLFFLHLLIDHWFQNNVVIGFWIHVMSENLVGDSFNEESFQSNLPFFFFYLYWFPEIVAPGLFQHDIMQKFSVTFYKVCLTFVKIRLTYLSDWRL